MESSEEYVNELIPDKIKKGNILPFSFPSLNFQKENIHIINGVDKLEISQRQFNYVDSKDAFTI